MLGCYRSCRNHHSLVLVYSKLELVHSKLVLALERSKLALERSKLVLARNKLVLARSKLVLERSHGSCHACRTGQLVHQQRKQRSSSKQLDSKLKIDSSGPP